MVAVEKSQNKNPKGFEETLWGSANKLRGSVESSEYKHVVKPNLPQIRQR